MKKSIVTSGVDSEYVLAELCEHLRDQGHSVTEFDFGQPHADTHAVLSKISSQETVYITSAHLNLSLRVASVLLPDFSKSYPEYLSPLEVLEILKPQKSIFIPHDLLNPYGDENLNEFRFLGTFDHILAPIQGKSLGAALGNGAKVQEAGWIKYRHRTEAKALTEADTPPKIVFFISLVQFLRSKYGIEGIVEYVKPMLSENVSLKFPAWSGIDEVEDAVRNVAPGSIVPSTRTSTELIEQADIVICNGASSIHAESCLLGCPTVCLLDEEGFSADEQAEKLKGFPDIYFHDYRLREPLPADLIQNLLKRRKPSTLKPFDFAMVEQILENG